MKNFYKKVEIVTYYDLDGERSVCKENPLHGKTFNNVNVEIKTEIPVYGVIFEGNTIFIDGEEPIDCVLLDTKIVDDTLILSIYQEWGY